MCSANVYIYMSNRGTLVYVSRGSRTNALRVEFRVGAEKMVGGSGIIVIVLLIVQ